MSLAPRAALVAVIAVLAPSAHGASSTVVISEVRAAGPDWIELYNPSDAEADLSGYLLADSGVDGSVKRETALRFPEGTRLAPHAYLLIVANRGHHAGDGPQSQCVKGGPPRCLHARWGVGQSGRDTVRLLRADGSVAAEATYPATGVPRGASWGRIPDADGPFRATRPTPGRRNEPR